MSSKYTQLVAPNGVRIRGLLCNVQCIQEIVPGTARRAPSGELTYDMVCANPTICWGSEYPVTSRNITKLYVDENGDTWHETQLELRDRRVSEIEREVFRALVDRGYAPELLRKRWHLLGDFWDTTGGPLLDTVAAHLELP